MGSNHRPPPCQGGALPLSYVPLRVAKLAPALPSGQVSKNWMSNHNGLICRLERLPSLVILLIFILCSLPSCEMSALTAFVRALILCFRCRYDLCYFEHRIKTDYSCNSADRESGPL